MRHSWWSATKNEHEEEKEIVEHEQQQEADNFSLGLYLSFACNFFFEWISIIINSKV